MEGLIQRLEDLAEETCKISIEKTIEDNEGMLVLFSTGDCEAAAYIYDDGTLFHLRDWQSARPESIEEIADYDWLTEDGRPATMLNGHPRRFGWGGARNYAKGSGLRKTLTCRIDPETMAAIDRLAEDLGISKGKVIDEIVKAYIEQCEEEGRQ